MRRSMVRGGLAALLAILSSAGLREASAGSPSSGQAATVRAVTARLQHHQWPAGSFTSNTTLQIGTRHWGGTRAVRVWWQSQFRLNLQIALISSVTVRNGRAEAILRRSTRSGAC